MQDFFDQQQRTLIDYLDNPKQNTVGHFVTQTFAGGGFADTCTPNLTCTSLSSGSSATCQGLLSRITSAAQKTFAGNSTKYGCSPLGMGFYNSPPYIAARYTDLGKFFSGGEPGNFYTNRYEQPQKEQAIKSEDPSNFYARWYNRMREFAQAEEVASRGQGQVRTK